MPSCHFLHLILLSSGPKVPKSGPFENEGIHEGGETFSIGAGLAIMTGKREMIDVSASGDESCPKRDLPPWTVDPALIKSDPELHHYTTRSGLQGIWETNSLWATHFSNLSDSSEIVLLKKPLEAALTTLFKRPIIENQRKSLKVRRHIEKEGGLEAVARGLAQKFVEAHFVLAITGGKVSPLAEPFICSLCSHANDHPYEQENGLLSQWRGYGGKGHYAIVFDTRQLDLLLAREWQAHFWARLSIERVVYFDGPEILEKEFPDILTASTAFMAKELNGESGSNIELFGPFSKAATLMKHRGFREEREVRIVAMPQSERALADRGRECELLGRPPIKDVHGNSKKYVALFESLNATLPIKRIIVGPGANQKEDYEFARALVANRVPIVISETPFIG